MLRKTVQVIVSLGVALEQAENILSFSERQTDNGDLVYVVRGNFSTLDNRTAQFCVYFDENEEILGFNIASPKVPTLAPW